MKVEVSQESQKIWKNREKSQRPCNLSSLPSVKIVRTLGEEDRVDILRHAILERLDSGFTGKEFDAAGCLIKAHEGRDVQLYDIVSNSDVSLHAASMSHLKMQGRTSAQQDNSECCAPSVGCIVELRNLKCDVELERRPENH